jgi:hypothetical protein
MFKSKARKQAEFLLKVEREKERLQQREAASQKAAEDIQELVKACIDGYKATYQRHPKTTIISTLVVGILVVLKVGGILSNSSEPLPSPVTESAPVPVVAQSLNLKAKVPKPAPANTASPIPAAPQAIPVEKVEQSKLQQEPNYRLGDTVQSGNWDFTALSTNYVGKVAEKGYFKAEATGEWVVVHGNLKNISDRTDAYWASNFKMTDSQERTYNLADSLSVRMVLPDEAVLSNKDITPGVTVNVSLLFDVAPDATGLKLVFEPGFSSKTIDLKTSGTQAQDQTPVQSPVSISQHTEDVLTMTASIIDPPSNVRNAPNGAVVCSISTQTTISIYERIGEWYKTDACSSSSFDTLNFIHESQINIDEKTSTTGWGTLHSNDGRINLRTGPGTVNKAAGYGVNGDRVQVLDSSQDSGGYSWYKVSFPKSGAIGWVAAQLIKVDQ